jgi:hypothetical protein
MISTTDSVITTFAEKRASWGAIIAGTAVALGVQVSLAVLGIAIGASVINPLYEADPVEGIGIGAGIYFLISAILAVLAGGYVAGSLSRVQERRDRTLHGLATWALVTLMSVLLLATGLGRLVGGTMSIVSSGLSQAGSVASAVAGSVADQKAQGEADSGEEKGEGLEGAVESLRQEARELLRSTGEPALQPGELEETAEQVGDQATDAAARVARNPDSAEQVIDDVFDRMKRAAQPQIEAVDRDALVSLLVEHSDLSRAQAEQTVGNWERTYADARANWEAMKAEAEQRARELGQKASDAVATAAWWSFFMLVLTAIAAAGGANLGANRKVVAVSEHTTRT